MAKRASTLWADAIRMEALKLCTEEGRDQKKIQRLAQRLIQKAIEGDVSALKEIGDRLDGKPVQQQILSGDPEAPLQVVSNKPLSAEDWAIQYGTAANQD